jgi:hypothetical protein
MLRPIRFPYFLSWWLVLCLTLGAIVASLRTQSVMSRNAQGETTGQISGIVTDIEGRPLTNVTVYAHQDLSGNGHWQSVNFSYTNTTGAY